MTDLFTRQPVLPENKDSPKNSNKKRSLKLKLSLLRDLKLGRSKKKETGNAHTDASSEFATSFVRRAPYNMSERRPRPTDNCDLRTLITPGGLVGQVTTGNGMQNVVFRVPHGNEPFHNARQNPRRNSCGFIRLSDSPREKNPVVHASGMELHKPPPSVVFRQNRVELRNRRCHSVSPTFDERMRQEQMERRQSADWSKALATIKDGSEISPEDHRKSSRDLQGEIIPININSSERKLKEQKNPQNNQKPPENLPPKRNRDFSRQRRREESSHRKTNELQNYVEIWSKQQKELHDSCVDGIIDYQEYDENDEEGAVDTSKSSDGGLTSRLSLCSSEDSQQKLIGIFKSCAVDDCITRDDLHKIMVVMGYQVSLDDIHQRFPINVEFLTLKEFLQWYSSHKDKMNGEHARTNELEKGSEMHWDKFATLVVRDAIEPPPDRICKDTQVLRDIMTLSSTRDSVLDNDVLERKATSSPNNTERLQMAALNALRNDVVDLSSRLEMVTQERDMLESSLSSAQIIKERIERENANKLDSTTQHYEERITELHSVIAELTKKAERQRNDVIVEEGDVTEDEHQPETFRNEECYSDASREMRDITEESASDSSGCKSNGGTKDFYTDISTSCEIDNKAVEAGACISDLEISGCRNTSVNSHILDGTSDQVTEGNASDRGSSFACEEDEMRLLKEENANLQEALSLAQHTLVTQRSTISVLRQEKEQLKKQLQEAGKWHSAIHLTPPQVSDAKTVKGLRGSSVAGSRSSSPTVSGTLRKDLQEESHRISPSVSPVPPANPSESTEDIQITCKLAEKVRLKKTESGDPRITASDLHSVGLVSTAVAEQLSASVQEESTAQELFHSLATAGGTLAPHDKLREYELEIERLHARMDHFKSQNDLLTASLSESRAITDRLALLMGKLESRDVALKMTVDILDQSQEAFEILTALQENEISFLVASCRAAGIGQVGRKGDSGYGSTDEALLSVRRAQEQRRTTENVARHLISRLDENNKQHRYDENGRLTEVSSSWSSTSSGVSSDGSRTEEHLRSIISRLQDERTKIYASLQHVDNTCPEYYPICQPLPEAESLKLDLENAVLMQELTAVREERAELRAQVYLLDREKNGLELRVGTLEATYSAYRTTIDHLRSELQHAISHKDRNLTKTDEDDSDLTDALRRESKLNERVHDLLNALEEVVKNSEAKNMQSQEFIADLKKANAALLNAVDRLKRKYNMKVKRLEQQTIAIMEKHNKHVRASAQQNSTIEENSGIQMLPASASGETSL